MRPLTQEELLSPTVLEIKKVMNDISHRYKKHLIEKEKEGALGLHEYKKQIHHYYISYNEKKNSFHINFCGVAGQNSLFVSIYCPPHIYGYENILHRPFYD